MVIKKILVTGSSGTIGTRLCEICCARGGVMVEKYDPKRGLVYSPPKIESSQYVGYRRTKT